MPVAMAAAVNAAAAVEVGGRQSHRAGWLAKKSDVLAIPITFRRFRIISIFLIVSLAVSDAFGRFGQFSHFETSEVGGPEHFVQTQPGNRFVSFVRACVRSMVDFLR